MAVRPENRKIDDRDEITAHELRERGSYKWTRYEGEGDTIGAFVAEMDFGTAPAVVRALQAAVDAQAFGYLPPGPAADLAQACAAWQQERYGWPVAPEQVVPVSDVLTALELVLRHLSRPGSAVIVPTPAYPPFLAIPPRHGRAVVEVPMLVEDGRYRLDLAGLDRAYRAGGDLLLLCHPANPVGRVFAATELAGLTELVDRHGGWVFADEVHAPLVFPGHGHLPYAGTSPEAAAHTITATSAAKAWNLSGLKCAQVVLPPAQLPNWQQASTGAATPSTLGVVAGTAAYRAGGAWLDGVVGYLDRNRQALGGLLAAHLPQLGYHPPEGTYLAWLDCRRLDLPGPPDAFFRDQAGVALLDGGACGQAGQGFVRLNFATPLPILQRAVTRMAHAVRAPHNVP